MGNIKGALDGKASSNFRERIGGFMRTVSGGCRHCLLTDPASSREPTLRFAR